jgi:hypothetical protein
MTVPTEPIVPPRLNGLTYGVWRGTVPSKMIVPSIVPHSQGTVRGTVDAW